MDNTRKRQFKSVTNDDLEILLCDAIPSNTKKKRKWAMNMLIDWCGQNDTACDFNSKFIIFFIFSLNVVILVFFRHDKVNIEPIIKTFHP